MVLITDLIMAGVHLIATAAIVVIAVTTLHVICDLILHGEKRIRDARLRR